MKLRKIELKLEGDEYWPKLTMVHVPGSAVAKPIPEGASQSEKEDVIKSWDQAAVLRVTPADGKALVGFWVDSEHCQYLNVPVETTGDGLFAMRIGDAAIDFFIVPEDHKTNYQLELVAVTNTENPEYAAVPLY